MGGRRAWGPDRPHRECTSPERIGFLPKTAGDPLIIDDTAICHTESEFSCPGSGMEFEQMVNTGQCTSKESVKIDKMCEDGPCDSDPDSLLCQAAKRNCEVDPETGVKCMPGSENDPCDCSIDAGAVAFVTFASLFALAAAL